MLRDARDTLNLQLDEWDKLLYVEKGDAGHINAQRGSKVADSATLSHIHTASQETSNTPEVTNMAKTPKPPWQRESELRVDHTGDVEEL